MDLVAILCVIGSALAACFNSLIMERLMKDEDEPFHIQKVRLDAGTVIWSILFLPIMGLIATEPKYKIWAQRPSSQACTYLGRCEQHAFVANNGASLGETGSCKCG